MLIYEYLQGARLPDTVEYRKEDFNFTTIIETFLCLGWLSILVSNACKY